MTEQKKTNPVRQEQQGPASLHAGGPAAGYSLKDLGQPTRSQNADAVMKEHFDHPKQHSH